MNEKEVYQEKIIDLIRKCDSMHWLKTIYAYVRKLLE